MNYPKISQNTVKRGNKKASYNKTEVHSILDNNEICTIAFEEGGQLYSQPINYGREGEKLYLHGHAKNRMTTALIKQGKVCLSVFELDAMKFTRSAYSHSVNFKSVVVFGIVRELVSDEEKFHGLKTIINHFVPSRWQHCRKPNEKELQATRVLEISITSASAKIANTPPADDEEDKNTDFWTGIIPVKKKYEYPKTVDKLRNDIKIPQHILDFYQHKQS